VQAWNRVTGEARFAIPHDQNCWAIAESPDGKTLATVSFDGYLRLAHAATGKLSHPPIEHPGPVLTVAFSPDGRFVGTACSGSDWPTRLSDVSTGMLHCAMTSKDYLTDVRFTPDSRFAVIADAKGLQMWDINAGYPVCRWIMSATGAIPQLDIASDGRWAVQRASGVANRAHDLAWTGFEELVI